MPEYPSQIRYRKEHPLVAFRCKSRKEWVYLHRIAEEKGMSLSDFLRAGVYKGKEIVEKAYINGFKYAEALFGIFVQCPHCNRHWVIQPRHIVEFAGYGAYRKWVNSLYNGFMNVSCGRCKKPLRGDMRPGWSDPDEEHDDE